MRTTLTLFVLSLLVTASLAAGCQPNESFPARPGYDGGLPPPLGCTPNLDGVIEARELRATLGVPVGMLVSPPGVTRSVNVAGTTNASGQRVWDLSLDYADDGIAHMIAEPVSDFWFASSFPGAEFVAPADAAGRMLGVYAQTDSALQLYGLASREEAPPEGKTLLVYDAPIDVYRFPLSDGDSWVSSGEVTGGTLRGLPYAGRDTYQVDVRGAGTLELPDLIFDQARRVDLRVTVEPAAGASVQTRQVSWLFECFGEVARATSQSGEMAQDFTTTAELRRLALE